MKVAIFDMDGVLVDNSPFHRESWRRLVREEGRPPLPPEFWRLTIGRPVEEAVEALWRHPLPPGERRRLATRKTALYHELADGQAADVPGVAAFVSGLVAAGVPRALATSAGPESARVILAGLGLEAAFAVRVTAADVRRGKPDPEVYRTAAARLRVAPEACIVFEDAVVGVEAARRAGMAVVGLTTAYPADDLRAAGAMATATDFRALDWSRLVTT